MRAVAQRVREASVRVRDEEVSRMAAGVLALVGVGHDDDRESAAELARRLVHLRIFADDAGRMNRSLLDTGGTLCVVSQFTLMADTRKGRRPSFGAAAPGEVAEPLVDALMDSARAHGAQVVGGRFGADMRVSLVNDGPVTLWIDTAA